MADNLIKNRYLNNFGRIQVPDKTFFKQKKTFSENCTQLTIQYMHVIRHQKSDQKQSNLASNLNIWTDFSANDMTCRVCATSVCNVGAF